MREHIYQLNELLEKLNKDGIYENLIACFGINAGDKLLEDETPAYSDGFAVNLIESGSAVFNINYKEFKASKGDLVLFSPLHHLSFIQVDNFSTKTLIVKKDLFDELPLMRKTYKPLYWSLLGIHNPVTALKKKDFNVLSEAMQTVRSKNLNEGHSFHREVIKTALTAFILDFEDVVSKCKPEQNHLSRQDMLLMSFLELLTLNYKEKHEISFYTDLLHVTPQYLSLVVKKITGYTASELSYEMLLSEARILLYQPELTIQEIAEQLKFSDQSSFGKFFSRRTGMSPLNFRKRHLRLIF